MESAFTRFNFKKENLGNLLKQLESNSEPEDLNNLLSRQINLLDKHAHIAQYFDPLVEDSAKDYRLQENLTACHAEVVNGELESSSDMEKMIDAVSEDYVKLYTKNITKAAKLQLIEFARAELKEQPSQVNESIEIVSDAELENDAEPEIEAEINHENETNKIDPNTADKNVKNQKPKISTLFDLDSTINTPHTTNYNMEPSSSNMSYSEFFRAHREQIEPTAENPKKRPIAAVQPIIAPKRARTSDEDFEDVVANMDFDGMLRYIMNNE